jgi:hypothetical protein
MRGTPPPLEQPIAVGFWGILDEGFWMTELFGTHSIWVAQFLAAQLLVVQFLGGAALQRCDLWARTT